MRKLKCFMHMSLDGCVQGANEWDINWIAYNDEMEQYANETITGVDTVVWGRNTFLGMQQYWSAVPGMPTATEHEKAYAAWLEKTHKVVVSKTIERVDWNNTTLIKEHVAEEFAALKQQSGQDILILGSPTLAQSLMHQGLIDEYRVTVSPVVLGDGLRMFAGLNERITLELTESKVFQSGALGLVYQPKS